MTFAETCNRVAQQFIQTVLVIDDLAIPARVKAKESYVAEPPDNYGYEEPKVLSSTPAEPLILETIESDDPDPTAHTLDGAELTRNFASMGINCALYVPSENDFNIISNPELQATPPSLVARRADIVVIDWLLDGVSSNLARGLICSILKDDFQQGGRLRLIAVYTGVDDLLNHRNDLKDQLGLANIIVSSDDTDGVIALTAPQLRIVFLHKEHFDLKSDRHCVSEAQLPSRLVKEFSQLSMGVMPVVALGAIAAVRDGTHKMLSKFNNTLDPALAAHRSMLPTPTDAEAYADMLVTEEMLVCIDNSSQVRLQASEELFNEWVDHLVERKHVFKFDDANANELKVEQVKKFLSKGQSSHKSIKDSNGAVVINEKDIWKYITNLFSSSNLEAETANLAFSRIALLEREAYGQAVFAPSWTPKLTLGSVLASLIQAEDGKQGVETVYHVCLQPLCDSVRLPSKRAFPLLPLKIGKPVSDKFSMVVRTRDQIDLRLFPEMKPHRLEMVNFAPTSKHGSVKAVLRDNQRIFNSLDKSVYEWIGDMRAFAAQRIAHQLSSQMGRVGLDEYEWLRRSAGL